MSSIVQTTSQITSNQNDFSSLCFGKYTRKYYTLHPYTVPLNELTLNDFTKTQPKIVDSSESTNTIHSNVQSLVEKNKNEISKIEARSTEVSVQEDTISGINAIVTPVKKKWNLLKIPITTFNVNDFTAVKRHRDTTFEKDDEKDKDKNNTLELKLQNHTKPLFDIKLRNEEVISKEPEEKEIHKEEILKEIPKESNPLVEREDITKISTKQKKENKQRIKATVKIALAKKDPQSKRVKWEVLSKKAQFRLYNKGGKFILKIFNEEPKKVFVSVALRKTICSLQPLDKPENSTKLTCPCLENGKLVAKKFTLVFDTSASLGQFKEVMDNLN
ncbi:hypothetical protein QTN25_010176 [Entamoeba marina]